MGKYVNKELFGERLKELMTDYNESTYSLGEFLSVAPSTISRYTTAEIAPKIPTIEKLAIKFNVNVYWLMGTPGAEKYLDNRIACKKIPLVGTIAAGRPILAQETFEGCEYVPENLSIDFCLRVKGDSMVGARILDGDIVYVRKQPEVENGEIAVVIIDNEEATLKRVYRVDSSIILRAENPNFPDRVFSKKEAKIINIIGKAVMFKSEVR